MLQYAGNKIIYSRDELLRLRPCINTQHKNYGRDYFYRNKTERKRGHKGGVKERLRRRNHKPPLPSIILSNVRSIRNKVDTLDALCKFDCDYRNAGVICLTETWLTDMDTDNSVMISNFTSFRCDRDANNGKQKGGGVCVYINNKWCGNNHIVTSSCQPDIELLSLSVRPYYLPREFPVINIIAVYIPPTCCRRPGLCVLEETPRRPYHHIR